MNCRTTIFRRVDSTVHLHFLGIPWNVLDVRSGISQYQAAQQALAAGHANPSVDLPNQFTLSALTPTGSARKTWACSMPDFMCKTIGASNQI